MGKKENQPELLFEADAPAGKDEASSETKDTPLNTRTYVLSSNYTLPALLARGCLLSPNCGESSDIAFLDQFAEALPYRMGQLPRSWSESVEASVRNAFPIAIRMRKETSPRSLKLGDPIGTIEAVLLEDVDGLIFRKENELKLFESWSFDNYAIRGTGLELCVDATVFNGDDGSQSEPAVLGGKDKVRDDGSGNEPKTPNEDILQRVDALTAILAVYMKAVPANEAWMKPLENILEDTDPTWSNTPADILPSMVRIVQGRHFESKDNLEAALLHASIETILKFPVNAGWPSHEVLQLIYDTALDRGLREGYDELRHALDTWQKRCVEALDAKEIAFDLTDDPVKMVRRALVLLLLRGELNAVDATRTGQSSEVLKVGVGVQATARCLAAIRTGFRSLPQKYKFSDEIEGPVLLQVLGRLLVDRYCVLAGGGERMFVKPPVVNYEHHGEFDGSWKIFIEDNVAIRRQAKFDPNITRLYHLCRALNYERVKAVDDGLVLEFSIGGDEFVMVRLSILTGDDPESRFVRFLADAEPDQVTKDSDGAKATKSKLGNKKQVLLEMLMRNSDPDMHCRLAIDRSSNLVVVITDQLLATLDEDEFHKHVQAVAEVAHGFSIALSS